MSFKVLPILVLIIFIMITLIMYLRLFVRARKDVAIVRTGFGPERIIIDGGAVVLPGLHDITQIGLCTHRIGIYCAGMQALTTKDGYRVNLEAEFYMHVELDAESISKAARTLGRRTMETLSLKEIIDGKCVNALRTVVKEFPFPDIAEYPNDVMNKVCSILTADIADNGLKLESASLISISQAYNEDDNDSRIIIDQSGNHTTDI